jgi:hypothetical protein
VESCNVGALEGASGRYAAKKTMMAIASLLFAVAGLAVPNHAAQQEGSQQVKRRSSYATNTPQEALNFANNFYLTIQEV